MGTPIPEPIIVPPVPAGNDCTICWGIGKPYGDGDTPESIKVNFSGIAKADDWDSWMLDPFEGEFELDQFGIFPCHFRFTDAVWMVNVIFHTLSTEIVLEGRDGGFQFLSPNSSECATLVFNEREIRYVNGTCKILIPEIEA